MLRRITGLAPLPPWRVALTVGLGVAATGFGVALLTSAGYLISRAAERPPVLSLMTVIVAVRFFGLARPLTRYLERLASHDLALRTLGRVRTRFYRRIEPLAPAELAGYRRGDLLERMIGDVDALQGVYLRVLGPPLVGIVVVLICCTAAAVVLPAAGLILAAGLVAAGVGVPALAWLLGRREGRHQASARGELGAELLELLRAAPELVVNGREETAVARVERADRRLTSLARHDALVGGLADGAGTLLAALTAAGVLLACVAAHSLGLLDQVLIAALTLLAIGSFDSVAALPGVARELSSLLASGRRVLDLCERVPAVVDPAWPLAAPRLPAAVALENVTAGYGSGEEPALRSFDLLLQPGRRIALVGPSGAGKTTVANLLLRFLDPERGRVTLAGCDLREYRQEDVRRTFALAGQDAHVFDSTIRQNLLLARPGASQAELAEALRLARIGDWIASLPDGLDTLVGEDGMQLSGGQRQRLILARALLARAPVLLLDEPTAHLDASSAEMLMDDVLEATTGRTVLLITHRPEGLGRMDEVLQLSGP